MTDEQLFLIVFLLFYIAESIFWISRNQVAFTGTFFKKYFLQSSNKYIGNDKGGLILANPLLPSRLLFISESTPLSMDETAVCSVSMYSLNFSAGSKINQVKLITWNDVTSVYTNDKEIYINNKPFLKCSTPENADKWAQTIQKISGVPKHMRNSIIKKIVVESFDIDEIVKRKIFFSKISFPLKMLCNMLTAYVFIIAPLIIIQFGFMYTVIYLFLSYLFIHLLTLASFIFTKYKSNVYISKSEFITILIKVSLFPPALMHVNDYLSIKLLDKFHPLALGLKLLQRDDFKLMVKNWMLKLYFPLNIKPLEKKTRNVIEKFNHMEIDYIESFLGRHEINIRELIHPKLSDDPNLKSYCPRCHCEYSVEKGYCSDCNDIELVSLSKAKESFNNE